MSPKQFPKRQQTHKTLLAFRSVENKKGASGTHSEAEESVHTLTAQFFKTYFNIIPTLTLGLSSFLYPSSSRVFLISPILVHTQLNLLDFLFP